MSIGQVIRLNFVYRSYKSTMLTHSDIIFNQKKIDIFLILFTNVCLQMLKDSKTYSYL